MVIVRRHLIREGFVSTYHVWSRCVRKAWLQGKDFDSGRDLMHRKAWVKNQLIHLSESFWTAGGPSLQDEFAFQEKVFMDVHI